MISKLQPVKFMTVSIFLAALIILAVGSYLSPKPVAARENDEDSLSSVFDVAEDGTR